MIFRHIVPMLGICALSCVASVRGGTGQGKTVPAEFEDAPAVVLSRHQTWELKLRGSSTTTHSNRLLIQDRRGLVHADQMVAFGSYLGDLTAFSASTVLPNGERVPVPPSLQHRTAAGEVDTEQVEVLQFTFPQAKVGAVLEWEYTLTTFAGQPFTEWRARDDIPVMESGFEATVRFPRTWKNAVGKPPQLVLFSRGDPDPYCTVLSNRTTWESAFFDLVCRNVPAVEPEPLSPPAQDLRLDFHITLKDAQRGILSVTIRKDRAIGEAKEIAKFTKTRGKTAKITKTLIRGKKDTGDRLAAINRFLFDELALRDEYTTTDEDSKKGRARNVDDVIDRGGGTAREITLVALAMLEQAGIKVQPVLAHDRTTGGFRHNMFGGGDHLMLQLRVGGQPWYWDPSCAYCPPGLPDWRYTDSISNAIVVSESPTYLTVEPSAAEESSATYSEDLAIAADGSAAIDGRVTWRGHDAAYLREMWAPLSDDAREDSFRRHLHGAIEETTLDWTDPDDLTTPLAVGYAFNRENIPRTDDGRVLLLPPDYISARLPVPSEEQRVNPVWLPFQYTVRQTARFQLPEGYELVGDPPGSGTVDRCGLTFTHAWTVDSVGQAVWTCSLTVSTIRVEAVNFPGLELFRSEVRQAFRKGLIARPVGAVSAVTP